MSWVVIGDTGLFGSEMADLLEKRGQEVLRFNRSTINLDSSSECLAEEIGHADFIVNAVGYTKVDSAERENDEADKVNGIYAGKLAETSMLLGAKFFHISTDYVFDGETSTPYSVNALTNPISVYGKSKVLGEQLVARSGANFTIFRTSWLYGAKSQNFAKTIAEKLINSGCAKIVNDQFGTPTWTRDLADVIYQHGINSFSERIVHAVASGYGSWFDFACEIAGSLPDGDGYLLSPVGTDAFPTVAKRPAFSALDNSETKGQVIGDWRERWRIAAPLVLAEYLPEQGS